MIERTKIETPENNEGIVDKMYKAIKDDTEIINEKFNRSLIVSRYYQLQSSFWKRLYFLFKGL